MIGAISRFRRDSSGAAVIEFAILAPVIFAMLLGVIQVGLSMQAQNALRSIASQTARYAVVEYQKGNEVTDGTIKAKAEEIATSAPYLLDDSFGATIAEVATPRIDGTFEKTLTLRYTPPSILPFVDWTSREMTFARPIFVIDE